jgi:hypothetical protein
MGCELLALPQRQGRTAARLSFPRGQCNQPLPVARRIHFRPHAEATCPNSCSLSGSALAPLGPKTALLARRPRANCHPSQMLISRSNHSTEPTISVHSIPHPSRPSTRSLPFANSLVVKAQRSSTALHLLGCNRSFSPLGNDLVRRGKYRFFCIFLILGRKSTRLVRP